MFSNIIKYSIDPVFIRFKVSDNPTETTVG